MGETLRFFLACLRNISKFWKKPKNIKTLSIIFFCLMVDLLFFQNCMQRNTFKADEYSASPNFFDKEWHIRNTGASGGLAGQDINVETVWASSIKGKGINVVVVDQGIQLNHTDLIQNASRLSWNFASPGKGTDTSSPGDGHGTCVAGIIAAADNGYGVTGVAPESKIIGYNISGSNATVVGGLTGTVNGQSNISQIDVSNNSWGPKDERGTYQKEENYWVQAIETGLSNGRGGLGTVYVWAAGNGGSDSSTDRSNYDGGASYHGVISVCATDDNGEQAEYSESGSNLWICSYGGGTTSGHQIVTTDIEGKGGFNPGGQTSDFGDDRYTKNFAGTSAAAPVVSGIVGLILNKAKAIGKRLSWRDVKWILAQSAKNPPNATAATNGYGLTIYDGFGFGIADAGKAVTLVNSWAPVGETHIAEVPSGGAKNVGSLIPNANSMQNALSSSFDITSTINPTGISRIEFIDLNINLTHPNWAELEIQLVHSGVTAAGVAYTTTDIITKQHSCRKTDPNVQSADGQEQLVDVNCSEADNGGSSEYSFRFGVARHLGENPNGTWELKIYDSNSSANSGTLTSWGLKFYGE